MKKLINIAIDGPAASGKGITAKKLAKILGYKYLDTGAMYRAITYYLNNKGININSFNIIHLKDISINFNNKNRIEINGKDIEDKIRNENISKLTYEFSKIKVIRDFLGNLQKQIIKEKGFIADGRDIGSVIMPDAEVKIYLTASLEVRAKRRYLEYKEKGDLILNLNEIKKQLIIRDKQDIERKFSPLVKTNDAIEIDTSNLTIEEQTERILKIINLKIN